MVFMNFYEVSRLEINRNSKFELFVLTSQFLNLKMNICYQIILKPPLNMYNVLFAHEYSYLSFIFKATSRTILIRN